MGEISVIPSHPVTEPSEEEKKRKKGWKVASNILKWKVLERKNLVFFNSFSICLNQFQCYQVSLGT